MTEHEAARILATLRALWRNWRPAQAEIDLWRDTVIAWEDPAPIIAAAQEARRRDAKGFVPDIATILPIAVEEHRAGSAAAESERRSAEYARMCRDAEQDAAENARWLREQPAWIVEKAKGWMNEQSLAAQRSGRIDVWGCILRGHPRLLVGMLVAVVQDRTWEKDASHARSGTDCKASLS